MGSKIKEHCFFIVFLTIVLWSVFHYFFDVRPWIESLSFGYPPLSVMLPADPHVYWRFANFVEVHDLPINVFGPSLILKFWENSSELVFLFSFSIFLYAILVFARAWGYSFYLVAVLFLANPIILAQVFYPNKEIFMMASSLFLLSYDRSRIQSELWWGLVLVPFTKIEFMFIILFWLWARRLSVRKWTYILVATVLMISLFYNWLPGIRGRTTVLSASSAFGSMGMTAKFNYLASNFHLFFLVMIPRVVVAVLSGVLDLIRYPEYFTKGFTTVISSFVMAILFVLFCLKSYATKITRAHLFIFLWLIAVATVPFALHRYLIPCYPFLYATLLDKLEINSNLKETSS